MQNNDKIIKLKIDFHQWVNLRKYFAHRKKISIVWTLKIIKKVLIYSLKTTLSRKLKQAFYCFSISVNSITF